MTAEATLRVERVLLGFILGLVMIGVSPSQAAAQAPAPEEPDMNAARQAFEKGNYAEAERYYREAWRKAEARNASGARRASVVGNIAQVLRDQGRLTESEELFNDALRITETEGVDPAVRALL